MPAYYKSMEMTINLAALRRNADAIIKRSGTALCAVVKCNAYGHGDIECALALRDKAECFAVADISEALRLVGGGIKNDILILSDMYDEKGYPENLIFTAFDELSLMRLLRSGRRFALKADTGMHRLGFDPLQCANIIPLLPVKKIHSVFTHIYDASAARKQAEHFSFLTRALPVKKHIFASNFSLCASSAGDYVRCGIALYGYGSENLEKVMSLDARVLRVCKVLPGDNIGYGIFRAQKAANIATLDIGYGDGFMRKAPGERRSVAINGQKCNVAGQVCMDMTMAEVADGVKSGDRAEILGATLTARHHALEWNTSEYEVLVSLGHSRARRKYIN